MIDPLDHRPAYMQIADWLREQIRNGTYPVRSRLPSTSELTTRFEVAPGTVRSAVDELRRTRTVIGRHGAGVFVVAVPDPLTAAAVLHHIDQLHRPVDVDALVCAECGKVWPCPTVTLARTVTG